MRYKIDLTEAPHLTQEEILEAIDEIGLNFDLLTDPNNQNQFVFNFLYSL